jgi:aspartyl-tRNA(Asn)/glutamyl-tRNA(Gln) amidotransferase subunit A
VPVSFHLDHVGVIAPCAFDALRVSETYFKDEPSLIRLSERVSRLSRGGAKAGVLRGFFHDKADEETRLAIERACAQLSDATPEKAHKEEAVELLDVEPPASFANVHEDHLRIMAVEAAEVHREAFATHRDSFGPKVSELIERGLATSKSNYVRALERRLVFQQDLLDSFGDRDFLLCAATPSVAPGLDTTGDPSFNAPWSYAGFPTVTVPCGLASNGLPIGLQLIGRPNHDGDLLLRYGSTCDRRLEFSAVPEMVARLSS